jgi:lactoylglutathione lyase
MKYLHTMVRVSDLRASLDFYRNALGLTLLRSMEFPAGRYTLAYLCAPGDEAAQIELTHNWDAQPLQTGRAFGHIAYAVDDLYGTCERLVAHGARLCRPPRDGSMAFARSPDGISIELLQKGPALAPREPWRSMPNQGEW